MLSGNNGMLSGNNGMLSGNNGMLSNHIEGASREQGVSDNL